MCGIAGILTSRPGANAADLVRAMADCLRHRGPDDSDVWTDAVAGIALGHRRLAILDLSPLGRQPMASPSGRYRLVFNGEIYNFAQLRRQLEHLGHSFRGGSDTEVLLAALEQWGLEPTLERCQGMFALALWDAVQATLHLVRDRLGIKPLYYGQAGPALVFGSELKALRRHPDFPRQVDRQAVALYLRQAVIPAPWSIHTAARKLPPGHVLSIPAARAAQALELEPRAYWSLTRVWQQGLADPFPGDLDEAVAATETLLTEAVASHMVADVPLGCLLSGGIDSSTVAALMQAASTRPVKTFSIGFDQTAFNEAHHAAAVARHLATDHTDLYVSARELLAVVPTLPRLWDEPFADASQIPTALVFALARRHVTVALSGDGGDECFAGYGRYAWGRVWPRLARLPLALRRMVAAAGRRLPSAAYRALGPWGAKLSWRMDLLEAPDFDHFYRSLLSHFQRPEAWLLDASEPPGPLLAQPEALAGADLTRRMQWRDSLTYLPDDILTKVDRASMAVGLEARVPLLDHRVVELAARLPTSLQVAGGHGKQVLRRILHRHVPPALVDRPKMGFGVPLTSWLRAELRPWAEALLAPTALERHGLLRAAPVGRLWRRFLDGETHWSSHLWILLMLQAWLETPES